MRKHHVLNPRSLWHPLGAIHVRLLRHRKRGQPRRSSTKIFLLRLLGQRTLLASNRCHVRHDVLILHAARCPCFAAFRLSVRKIGAHWATAVTEQGNEYVAALIGGQTSGQQTAATTAVACEFWVAAKIRAQPVLPSIFLPIKMLEPLLKSSDASCHGVTHCKSEKMYNNEIQYRNLIFV